LEIGLEHTFVAQTILSDCCLQLERQISNFWRLEELGKVECHSLEEKQCIEHFEKTVTKGLDGRFIVQLPFKENPIKIGSSKAITLKRFMSNENRLRINPKLKEAYLQFINEYIELGGRHIEQVSDNNKNDKPVAVECSRMFVRHAARLRERSRRIALPPPPLEDSTAYISARSSPRTVSRSSVNLRVLFCLLAVI